MVDQIKLDIHRSRYNRHTMDGMTVEQIAKADRVQMSTVKSSIDLVSHHIEMCTIQTLESKQIDVILGVEQEQRAALRQMLTAKDDSGQPDHAARAKALQILNEIHETVRPKGKGAFIQVGINNGGNNPQAEAPKVSTSYDFEGILRTIKQRRDAAQLPAHEGNEEGEVIEGDAPNPTS